MDKRNVSDGACTVYTNCFDDTILSVVLRRPGRVECLLVNVAGSKERVCVSIVLYRW